MKKSMSVFLAVLMVIALLSNATTMQAQAAVSQNELSRAYLNATVKYLNFNKKNTRTFDFDINENAKERGAKYTWYVKADKGNPDAVTINSKTGEVTAKKAGTAYIRCKITKSDGTVIRPEAKVIIRNNIRKVDISNMPEDQTITAGIGMDFNRTILDTDAGKTIASNGITRFEIDDDTSEVGSVSDSGIVFPVKEGSFNIRAVCFQSKSKYNQWLMDKEINAKNITAASKWYYVEVKDSEGRAIVRDKEQLEKALVAKNINEITLSTDKDINLVIKKGDYRDKSLIVDAPNAEIENFAVFKDVTIAAIKENTWSENAQGNSFHVTSIKIRIIVKGEAVIREILLDREDTQIELEIDGIVQRITVLQPAEMNLYGDGEQIPITIERTSSGTRITSSIPLKIKAEEETEIIVEPGAEGTSIEKSNKDIKVDVQNNSKQSVTIVAEDGEDEVIQAGDNGTSDGSTQPEPTPIPTPTPTTVPSTPSGGGGGYVPPASTLSSIAIKTPAIKSIYKVGETLDISGLTIEGIYSDQSKKTENITIANISGFNSSAVAPSQTLTVSVGTRTTTYIISVIKADGSALTGVSGDDALNTMSGMTSAMEFSVDKTTWTSYSAEAPNLPNLTGDVTLIVRFKETATHEAGVTSTFIFTEGVLESIAIKTPATKTVYKVGETLDITGLTIEGTYSDGGKKTETITRENISGFNSAAVVTRQTLTVTVGTRTTNYTISIIKASGPALTGVSIDDAINTISGMTSAMEFSTDKITWTSYNAEAPNLPDLTGDVTLSVRFVATATHEAGSISTFDFTEGVLESIAIKTLATKTEYKVGETLDITGLTIEGTYSDGGKKDETITTANVSGFDSSAVVASQTLTITVGTYTRIYTISVIKADGPAAPAAPDLLTRTDTSVTLVANSLYQFSKDAGDTWQDSEIFTGLTASTAYTFIARVKATATANESAASAGAVITTLSVQSGSPAFIEGTPAIFSTELTVGEGTLTTKTNLTYTWYRSENNTFELETDIQVTTGTTYTPVATDVEKFLIVVAISPDATGSGIVVTEAVVAKVQIMAFDVIPNVDAGIAGATTYFDATAVQAVLPRTLTANSGTVSVPVIAWVDTDAYNPVVAGSYTFTATLGAIPDGYGNTEGFTATVEVMLAPDITSPILSAIEVTDVTHNSATFRFTSSEVGTYYYLVFRASDSAPDTITIKAQGYALSKGTGVISAGINTVHIASMGFSYDFKAYIVVEDIAGNISEIATIDITTADYDFDKATGTINGYYGDEENLVIPSDIGGTAVKVIGNGAFRVKNTIKSIIIPEGVIKIEDDAFLDSKSVTSITIPSSVTSIGANAFNGCRALKSLAIPDNVVSIGKYAFLMSTGLLSIDVGENNANYTSQDGILYNKNKTNLIAYPAGKTNSEFEVPNTVTTISSRALGFCSNLESIKLSASITNVEFFAFQSCTALRSITIGDGVTIADYMIVTSNNNFRNAYKATDGGAGTYTTTTYDGVWTKQKDKYAVTFSAIGENGNLSAVVDLAIISSGYEVEEGKSVVFTASPAEGYQVKGWTLDAVAVADNKTNILTVVNLTAATEVTVEFEARPEVEITAVAGPINSVTGSAIIVLNETITDLTADDITVFKNGVEMVYLTDYTLSDLETTSISITFKYSAALDSDSVIVIRISKSGYSINDGGDITVTNDISSSDP